MHPRSPYVRVDALRSTRPVRVVRNDPQGFGGMLRVRLLADRVR